MDDIELDNLGKNREDEPPEDQEQQETTFNHPVDDDNLEWDDTTFDYPDDDGNNFEERRKNLDVMRKANRELGYRLGAKGRKITNIKKSVLWELGYKLKKGDGNNTRSLFDGLKLTEGENGNVNGMKFDGVKIIVLKGKEFKFSENVKFRSKVNEFQDLAREAGKEHEGTADAEIEKSIPDVYVDDNHAESIRTNSLERLEEEISDRSDRIIPLLTENEIREFRGLLNIKGPTLESKLETLKGEETYWKNKANRVEGDPQKSLLYETIAEVAKLKADQLRLKNNLKQ